VGVERIIGRSSIVGVFQSRAQMFAFGEL